MFKTWRYTLTGTGRFAVALAAATVAASAAVLVPQVASATTVTDPVGDFLSTYRGPAGADLDVVSAGALFDADNIYLTSTMAGDIGTTEGGLYVWGVDRGQGTEVLNHESPGQPAVGAGVLFDAFIRLDQNASGVVVLITPEGLKAQNLAEGAIVIDGRTISVKVPRNLLPGNGFGVADFGYNIWPRITGISANDQVADFAPDRTTFKASAIAAPEPASWALMILGFGAMGATLRRRRGLTAA